VVVHLVALAFGALMEQTGVAHPQTYYYDALDHLPPLLASDNRNKAHPRDLLMAGKQTPNKIHSAGMLEC